MNPAHSLPLRLGLGTLVLVTLAACSALDRASERFRSGPGGSSGPRYDTFLDSDDYRDGEEVVGAFLTDAEYGRMVEDLEYREQSFDWGWVRAAAGRPDEPTALAFSIRDYRTFHLEPVRNVSGKVAPGLEKEVESVLAAAMEQLGLARTESKEQADLALGAAIVDYKSDSTYFYFGSADPFIELELRLRDQRTGEDLLLARHQDHNSTPALGAADTASTLVGFLR